MSVIKLVIVGVAILIAGAGIGFWVGRSGLAGGNAKLEKVESDFAEYRQSVNKHFSKTPHSHFSPCPFKMEMVSSNHRQQRSWESW